MDKFIRVNIVKADSMSLGEYYKRRGWEMTTERASGMDEDAEGYRIVSSDGHVSWCPKARFEEVSRPIDGMTFGMAIEALKQGKKVARKGWNGRGMYLWLKPATVVKTDMCHDPYLKAAVEENGGELLALGTICMFTHDSTGRKAVLTGWLASQSDMLLEDWTIVD